MNQIENKFSEINWSMHACLYNQYTIIFTFLKYNSGRLEFHSELNIQPGLKMLLISSVKRSL